ncbi:MAG: serine/threonine protein phosphatase [Oscillospiraceae bacterium]|nr:serine/threonine protein phosphatase [Oscillospiraceae bacterium]
MICYAISDIHGSISAFEEALELVLDKLENPDTKLILLGDYIYGYEDNYAVLEKIMTLQYQYGTEKIIALIGNHEEMVCNGNWSINGYGFSDEKDDKYINWISKLPRYYTAGKTIFVHAGITEEAGEYWEYETDDFTFTEKYPAETGFFCENYKIVAGHVGTSEISGDSDFHGIYYDGQSHYYIDSTVLESGFLNVLKVDIENQKYYEVTAYGDVLIIPYEEEY